MKKTHNILVVSSFPRKKSIHDRTVVGIASYAKNTLLSLTNTTREKKVKVTVLAERIEKEKGYTQQSITVKRLWKRNSFTTFPLLLKEILQNHTETKTVMVQLELSMYGGVLQLLPFPFFLLALRLLGKEVTVVSHQVILDIKDIGPHINISQTSELATLYTFLIRFFYRLLLLNSNTVIVFEDSLKEKLSELGNPKKIQVIPHGVEEFQTKVSKREARKKLSINQKSFVVVVFGYLAWYKGTDWIAQAITKAKKRYKSASDIELILAGGPNPNHTDKAYYKRYIKGIEKISRENNIRLTGFVPENEIALYYKASDVVVLPYRSYMSASGPLSIAFSFEKPVLLSYKLKETLQNKDIQKSLKELKLNPEDLYFSDFKDDAFKKIQRLKRNKTLVSKLTLFSKSIKKRRAWKKIGERYYEEFVS